MSEVTFILVTLVEMNVIVGGFIYFVKSVISLSDKKKHRRDTERETNKETSSIVGKNVARNCSMMEGKLSKWGHYGTCAKAHYQYPRNRPENHNRDACSGMPSRF